MSSSKEINSNSYSPSEDTEDEVNLKSMRDGEVQNASPPKKK